MASLFITSKKLNMRQFWLFTFGAAVVLSTIVSQVHAANLNYNVDTTVSLTSPAINYTIVSGSVADKLIVNAGNIVVTVSSSTGGTFSVQSSDRNIDTSSFVGDAGAITRTCSNGLAKVTISQSTGSSTYTLSPDATICILGGAPPASSGGPSSSPAPSSSSSVPQASTTLPQATSTTSSAKDQIAGLQETLQRLIAQAKQFGIAVSPDLERAAGMQVPASAQAYAASSRLSATPANLSVGSTGSLVKSLQQFLNTHGFLVAGSGPGSLGNETERFGGLTRAALAKYQASVGISPASGVFGPKTRAYLKSLGF